MWSLGVPLSLIGVVKNNFIFFGFFFWGLEETLKNPCEITNFRCLYVFFLAFRDTEEQLNATFTEELWRIQLAIQYSPIL